METAILLDQPDVSLPGASRSMAFGPRGAPVIAILNGRGTDFEGGGTSPDLSLKWLPQGGADYRSEGRSYRLAGATQLLLNRGQPYRLNMLGRSESFVLFFPGSLVDAAWTAQTGRAESLPEIPTVAAATSAPLQLRLEALRFASQGAVPDAEALREMSCAVLAEIMALAALRRGQVARIPSMRRATREELLRRLIRAEGYLSDIGARATLAGAARAAALSPFHLIRLFDSVFGMTPLAYAAAMRLERARDALLQSRPSIAEIALAAGYESRTAFDRAFARRFGTTPGAVRKFAIPADASQPQPL
jgi:AraC family transcriptional regulator